ncbi:uncharacterized protein BX663DRAFT_495216 [Cokeromyces recurvatus]|uniref:uncharacterized protein n=1 Tax=Cokeromyces recurvatus TaxID=90255 RepID=UPI0022211793|nr:uncharacterized protein BX663DRAFT_495216 [Cokeromyces recurvatus]KAI7907216.1 hypothetical protein BX663DRAFT_495216 [Cokeromyces recurvatus]
MTNKREDNLYSIESAKIPSQCWWADEVLSSGEELNQLYQDFVLISEFSELEGPLPLAIVTESSYIDLKQYTDNSSPKTNYLKEQLEKLGLDSFDFNAFVLRVVSVDRSTEFEQIDEVLLEASTTATSSLFQDTSTTSLFSIPDDTQVYFTDSEHNFFAFTHHLTLFDINARGYVHPVALSYITRDPEKIINRFEELMGKFNEVSIKMKKGNYSNFILDLKYRLLDLEYTQTVLNDTTSFEQKPVLSAKAIEQAIIATKFMIDTLESSKSQINNLADDRNKIDNTTEPDIIPIIKNDDTFYQFTSDTIHNDDYKPKLIDTLSPVAHFERKLRSLAQLCQEPEENEQQESIKPTTLIDNGLNHTKQHNLTQKTTTMIPFMFSIIKPSNTNIGPVSSSEEECLKDSDNNQQNLAFANSIKRDMYSKVIKYMKDMVHYFGRNSVILNVNDEESLFINPVSSALTIGRAFMLNMDNPQPREREDHTSLSEEVTADDNDKNNDVDDNHVNVQLELDNDDKKEESCFPFLFAPLQLWKSEEKDAPKSHLLEVLRLYQSLIVDVIFSLLTGRTVLVQGSLQNKSRVQEVVQALSIFVPGKSQDHHQIIEWFDSTKLTDIQTKSIKLVGINKENVDSSVHIDSSCVLDIDVKNGSLNSSPVYLEGQWINQFLDRIMLFSSDEAYLAYLHTVFMNISLKAFVYHHLYVSDEFQLDESPLSSAASNKGYVSETNSESSTLSRKWSVRLMNYLKKYEDQESTLELALNTTKINSTSSALSSVKSNHDEDDFSEENQATVTLQNFSMQNNSKPRTVLGLFNQPTTRNEVIPDNPQTLTDENLSLLRNDSFFPTYSDYSRRESVISKSSSTSHDDEANDGDTINRSTSSLEFNMSELIQYDEEQDTNSYSSSDSDGDEEVSTYSMRRQRRRYKASRKKPNNDQDLGPDGISYIERRGRQYLQEKFKVYGDDQTIVIYLATCVI